MLGTAVVTRGLLKRLRIADLCHVSEWNAMVAVLPVLQRCFLSPSQHLNVRVYV
jgi:hypothetical protein